jgi:hypothetical protein
MTRLESQKTEIDQPADKLFAFLCDFNNFQKLMPPQVTNWQSTTDECSFTISGMATIGMKIIEKVPNSLIKITSNGKVPFQFNLDVTLGAISENKTLGQLIFSAELNPMIKMMVEKPLGNFFNLLSTKLKDIKFE